MICPVASREKNRDLRTVHLCTLPPRSIRLDRVHHGSVSVAQVEQSLPMRVPLSGRRWAANGTIVVKLGKRVLCRASVKRGRATCGVKPLPGPVPLRRRGKTTSQLRRYQLHLFYEGSNGYPPFSRELVVAVRGSAPAAKDTRRSRKTVVHAVARHNGARRHAPNPKHHIPAARRPGNKGPRGNNVAVTTPA